MFSLNVFQFSKSKKDGRETAVSGDIIPLLQLPVGRPARLVQSQVEPQINRRLAELGLTPGVSLSILQDSGGPLLLSVRGARVAVGRETAVTAACSKCHPTNAQTTCKYIVRLPDTYTVKK